MKHWVWMLLLLAACQPAALSSTPPPMPTALSCADYVLDSPLARCEQQGATTRITSAADAQAQLSQSQRTIVLKGDALLSAEALVLLSGVAVINEAGRTRILQAGQQFNFNASGVVAPVLITPEAEQSPALNADEASTQPTEASTTPSPTPSVACAPPATWTASYAVQRGDVLSRIASTYGVTLDELVAANCINDPNRIRVGLVLRVPPLP